MNEEIEQYFRESAVYCTIKRTIQENLRNKADLLVEEIMPLVEHLIRENDKLRKENAIFRMKEQLRNPKTIVVSEEELKNIKKKI